MVNRASYVQLQFTLSHIVPTGPRKLDCPSALLGFNFLALPMLGYSSSVAFCLTPLIGILPRAACKCAPGTSTPLSVDFAELAFFLFFFFHSISFQSDPSSIEACINGKFEDHTMDL